MTRPVLRPARVASGPAVALAALAVLWAVAPAAQTGSRLSASADAAPALAGAFATTPAAPPPTWRVLRDEPGAVVLEFTSAWPSSLATVVAERAGASAWEIVLATGGTQLSESVDLGAAVPPPVEVLSADVERVPLPTVRTDDGGDAWAEWRQPAASVGAAGTFRRRLVGSVDVRPVYVDGRELVRVRHLVVRVPRPSLRVPMASRGAGGNPHVGVTRSVLADGTWFRFPVRREGIYKITAAYLRDSLGVAQPDLARVQVYGNGGRSLPLLAGAPRTPDLAEVPTLLAGDAVYFFAEGPSWWTWTPGAGTGPGAWEHDINPYTRASHYFIRVDAPSPVRLQGASFLGDPAAVASPTVEARLFHEVDAYNQERDGGGSGLDWMGETLPRSGDALTVLDTLPAGVVAGAEVRYRAAVAGRATSPTTVAVSGSGGSATATLFGVNTTSSNTGNLLFLAQARFTGSAGTSLRASVRASGGESSSQNWLDWVEAFVAQRPTPGPGGVLRFATPGGQTATAEVALDGFTAEPQVWDVTVPGQIRRLGVQADGGRWRVQIDGATAAQPREVVAFDPAGAAVRAPRAGEAVANQNLHGTTGLPDYVVVAHPLFLAEARRLAEHRRTQDGLTTLVVTTEEVFNEFGGGTGDMSAIRDFTKFLYDRAPSPERAPRYLLLVGDGHYDYRNLESDQPSFVPVFETENMIHRINSYTSDDFFGLMDDDEGTWTTDTELMDLAVGRLTVTTPREAAVVVDKILSYDSPATRGPWRQRVTYVGDDQYPNYWDRDVHVYNADFTANTHQASDSTVTVQKIYGPSYPDVIAAGGRRRPQATDAIVRAINDGTLIWNYSGHGGITGLGDEQYFNRAVLDRLDNADRLAIFITATCSFGRFDMAERQSLAEDVFLKEGGGAVAMFTTVRVVYTSTSPTSGDNFGLNVELARQLALRDADGRPRRLGDILLATKRTSVGASPNNRKFNLLGDPAMRLGLPDGGLSLDAPPTLTAFEEATVGGTVLTPGGAPDLAFDGVVDVEVFDAERIVEMPQTAPRCNDEYTPCQNTQGRYRARTDRLYTGRATVSAGRFTSTFRVPQDVSYSGQPARIVAYASGAASASAGGASLGSVVGTVAGTRPDDGLGPEVRLFLDDTTFVSGGLTRRNPVFIARVSDPAGINTVGAGVGHELLLTLDGDASTAIDVGRYYTGDLDTYRSGTVRYPLPNLAPGPHTATFTAWDAVNNASTAEISFVVSDAEGLEVRNAFPYPNPTAGPTRFTFEHNQPAGTSATVQLRIFTLSGRPIRTLSGDEALPGGVLAGPMVQIPWDGRDDDGARLGSGIYLYRLRVETDASDGGREIAERVERLAIIR